MPSNDFELRDYRDDTQENPLQAILAEMFATEINRAHEIAAGVPGEDPTAPFVITKPDGTEFAFPNAAAFLSLVEDLTVPGGAPITYEYLTGDPDLGVQNTIIRALDEYYLTLADTQEAGFEAFVAQIDYLEELETTPLSAYDNLSTNLDIAYADDIARAEAILENQETASAVFTEAESAFLDAQATVLEVGINPDPSQNAAIENIYELSNAIVSAGQDVTPEELADMETQRNEAIENYVGSLETEAQKIAVTNMITQQESLTVAGSGVNAANLAEYEFAVLPHGAADLPENYMTMNPREFLLTVDSLMTIDGTSISYASGLNNPLLAPVIQLQIDSFGLGSPEANLTAFEHRLFDQAQGDREEALTTAQESYVFNLGTLMDSTVDVLDAEGEILDAIIVGSLPLIPSMTNLQYDAWIKVETETNPDTGEEVYTLIDGRSGEVLDMEPDQASLIGYALEHHGETNPAMIESGAVAEDFVVDLQFAYESGLENIIEDYVDVQYAANEPEDRLQVLAEDLVDRVLGDNLPDGAATVQFGVVNAIMDSGVMASIRAALGDESLQLNDVIDHDITVQVNNSGQENAAAMEGRT